MAIRAMQVTQLTMMLNLIIVPVYFR